MFLKTLAMAVKYIAMTVVGTIITLALLPIILPVLLLLWTSWLTVKLLILIKYRGKATMVTGTDVIHGKETQKSRSIINVVSKIHGKIDLEQIRAKVAHSLMNSYDEKGRRRYRRMLKIYSKAFGYYVFKDFDGFDIRKHINIITWEDIGLKGSEKDKLDHLTWEQTVKLVLKHIGLKPFPKDVPQWQILLLEHSKDKYTAFWRLHHAISDGVYFLRMFGEELLDDPIQIFSSYRRPPLHLRVLNSVWSFLLLPFGIMKATLNFDKNPLHGPELTGEKRFFISEAIPFATLKQMKMKSEVSLNAILFSCISYALSCHLTRKSSRVTKLTTLTTVPLQNPLKPIKLKNKFAVSSMKLPVPKPELNLGESDYSRLMPAKPEKISNHLPLSFRLSNPISRLKAVQKTLEKSKRDPSLLAANSVINLVCAMCPARIAEALVSVKGCSICVSNLPGPQQEVTLWSGHPEDLMFWVPDRDPMGVGVSIFSYNGSLRAGLIIDTALIDNDAEGDLIIKDFEKEVKHILYEIEESTNQNLKKQTGNDLAIEIV